MWEHGGVFLHSMFRPKERVHRRCSLEEIAGLYFHHKSMTPGRRCGCDVFHKNLIGLHLLRIILKHFNSLIHGCFEAFRSSWTFDLVSTFWDFSDFPFLLLEVLPFGEADLVYFQMFKCLPCPVCLPSCESCESSWQGKWELGLGGRSCQGQREIGKI